MRFLFTGNSTKLLSSHLNSRDHRSKLPEDETAKVIWHNFQLPCNIIRETQLTLATLQNRIQFNELSRTSSIIPPDTPLKYHPVGLTAVNRRHRPEI